MESVDSEGTKAFAQWYAKLVQSRGVNPNPDDWSDPGNRYDMREWYKNATPEERRQALMGNAHFTDQYKEPGYPTFSTDSQFYKPGIEQAVPAGQWLGDSYFPFSAQRVPSMGQAGDGPMFTPQQKINPLVYALIQNAYKGR